MAVARFLWAASLWVLLGASVDVWAQRAMVLASGSADGDRVALVIGNATYKESPLRNPVNDAEDVAAALRRLGFGVSLRTNTSRADMKAALRDFARQLREGGVGLFYYAGHGIQSGGRNYLIPVDASIQSEAELEFESIDANLVLSYMDDARSRVNIVVLDACRNNPFARGFRSASRGLAQMEAGRGTFIAFATAPGSVAADGEGRNGLYTRQLLESLKHQDSDIDKVFRRVTADVARVTRGEQVPWISSSLTGDFYFRPGPRAAAARAPEPMSFAPAMELAFWETIKNSRNPADFREYLVQYPSGRFAGLARNRLDTPQARLPQLAMAVPSATALPSTVPQPTLKTGDRWVMRLVDAFRHEETKTYEERVESVSGKLLGMVQTTLSAATADDKDHQGKFTLDVATWSTMGARSVEGGNMLVAFPLHIGKKWDYSFKIKNPEGEIVVVERKAEVVAWEEVRVPAGVFRALKIVHKGTRSRERVWIRGGRPSEETLTLWYAPEAKRWVKLETVRQRRRGEDEETVVELVKADVDR